MAKITAVAQKIFASSATPSGNIAVIGSTAAGSVSYTNDPATLMSLTRYLQGFFQQIRGNRSPVLQEENAIHFLTTRGIAYLQQAGVPEWLADVEYCTESVIQGASGKLFVSQQNGNLNHATTDTAWWLPYSTATAGDVKMTAAAATPAGWLVCDGSAVSRTTYATLFAAIGTTFGAGDMTTTFNVPDLRGRVGVGLGTGDATGATNWTAGRKAGEETHQLSAAELPNVQGPEGSNDDNGDAGPLVLTQKAGVQPNGVFPAAFGSNTPHNNVQPSLGLNHIIKT